MSNGKEWPTIMRNAQRTGCTTEVLKPPLKLVWKFEKGGYFWACPIIVDDRVYIAQDRLYALDLDDGGLVWQSDEIKTTGQPIGSTFWNDMLFVCGLNNMFAIDAQTGEIEFTVPSDDRASSTPCVYQGLVFWSLIKGKLIAADACTGAVKWTYDANSITRFSPAAADGTVYFADERYVYALDAMTGELEWSWCFEPKQVPTISPLHSAAVYENTLLVSLKRAGLFAIDTRDGDVRWHYGTKTGPFTAPCVADDVVYVAGWQLHAVNAINGQGIWISSDQYALSTSAPIVSGGSIYIGGGQLRAIYAFDRWTGEKAWEYETGDLVFSTPAIASGKLLIGCHDGYLYCFEEA